MVRHAASVGCPFIARWQWRQRGTRRSASSGSAPASAPTCSCVNAVPFSDLWKKVPEHALLSRQLVVSSFAGSVGGLKECSIVATSQRLHSLHQLRSQVQPGFLDLVGLLRAERLDPGKFGLCLVHMQLGCLKNPQLKIEWSTQLVHKEPPHEGQVL
mmetsp:Transcript_49675/g.116759  ORF Transcript_49675/g.116759 Transcript_49675/m.116759 type:complete len:157 (-) Transcript_49675:625-1095(-)